MKERHTIEIECSDQAIEELVPLLKELGIMGRQGSSRSIKIEDWDGESNFGFDGDGNAKIDTIKVDGETVEESVQRLADELLPIEEAMMTRKQIARRDFVPVELGGTAPPKRKKPLDRLHKPPVKQEEMPSEEELQWYLRQGFDRVTAKIFALKERKRKMEDYRKALVRWKHSHYVDEPAPVPPKFMGLIKMGESDEDFAVKDLQRPPERNEIVPCHEKCEICGVNDCTYVHRYPDTERHMCQGCDEKQFNDMIDGIPPKAAEMQVSWS